MTESVIQFEVEEVTVRGVLHRPSGEASGAGVILLHGWSGSRIGPHRMFVHAARRFAAAGLSCLRIDFRGRGDSGGDTATTTIPDMVEDTHAAVHWMRKRVAGPIVLLGICSGGKVAVAAAATADCADALVLWSAEPLGSLHGGGTSRRKTTEALRTYARKLTNLQTWKKIIRGQVQTDLVRRALVDHEAPSDEELLAESALLEPFKHYGGEMLFIFGGADPATADAAANYQAFCQEHGLCADFHEIEHANHSFYSAAWEEEVLRLTHDWLASRYGVAEA